MLFLLSFASLRYDVMRKCWLDIPEKRPNFNELYETFDRMLASQSDYLPAFDLMDDGDNQEVEDDINKKELQEVPPSYDEYNEGAAVNLPDITKTESKEYVDIKVKVKSSI